MIEWRTGTTARLKQIGIEPACDGSVHCVGVIHIRHHIDAGTGSWMEMHLTVEEIKWVRRQLKRALRMHESNASKSLEKSLGKGV